MGCAMRVETGAPGARPGDNGACWGSGSRRLTRRRTRIPAHFHVQVTGGTGMCSLGAAGEAPVRCKPTRSVGPPRLLPPALLLLPCCCQRLLSAQQFLEGQCSTPPAPLQASRARRRPLDRSTGGDPPCTRASRPPSCLIIISHARTVWSLWMHSPRAACAAGGGRWGACSRHAADAASGAASGAASVVNQTMRAGCPPAGRSSGPPCAMQLLAHNGCPATQWHAPAFRAREQQTAALHGAARAGTQAGRRGQGLCRLMPCAAQISRSLHKHAGQCTGRAGWAASSLAAFRAGDGTSGGPASSGRWAATWLQAAASGPPAL